MKQRSSTGDFAGSQPSLQLCIDEIRDYFCIGFRYEHGPIGLKRFPQIAVVFDDAVLHHRHGSIPTAMGMGIALFWFAMGGPTGMANAALARSTLAIHPSREIDELSLGLQTGERSLGIHRGDACRVVTPVFQLS